MRYYYQASFVFFIHGRIVRKLFMLPLLTLIWIVIFSSCRGTKHLQEDEKLLTGASVKIETKEKSIKKSELQLTLSPVIKPKPNEAILGLRPRLAIYNMIDTVKKDKGFKHWIKYTLGTPPVLLSDLDAEDISKKMQNRLWNQGYFGAQVNHEIIEKKKKARVVFTAQVDSPYVIKKVIFPQGKTEVDHRINNYYKEGSLLKPGKQYTLQSLINERQRISNELRNDGYYHYNPDYILFRVDSTVGKKQVNIYMTVKQNIPQKALNQYKINDIYIFSNYSLDSVASTEEPDTIKLNGYHYITRDSLFRPRVITRYISFNKGDYYIGRAHDRTIRHLMGLGPFKYVNIRFRETSDTINTMDTSNTSDPLLDSYIYLVPLKQKSLRLELEAVSKSNSFAGPGFNISFRNRNAFKGAELLIFNINTGYETQFGGRRNSTDKALRSLEFGINGEIHFPRFITPFRIKDESSRFVPKTGILLGYRFMSRRDFYRLNSFDLRYGFNWKETVSKEHELNPVSISLVRLGQTSEEFQTILDQNNFLQRSFEEQFILGSNYTFIYNSQLKQEKKNDFYFRGNIDISGHLAALTQRVLSSKDERNGDSVYTIFGTPFAQYSRLETDGRYYFQIDERRNIATRLFLGIGIPYGNSITLPYIKQYFAGGTTSLRAFRYRSVGPGTYQSPDTLSSIFFLDQTGDIKIETNAEYRFHIYNMFKGALFVDAGNVWLYNESEDKPGGKFRGSTFLRQFAIGTGVGFRIDAEFFVIRFDLAFPLRKPQLPQGERWVINEVNPLDSDWRKDNLLLNVAIGYPF